ncbi:nuclear pore-associated protein 1-like [Neomonachus schauinslandi]|uniref:Nuclear pore-associated protein 1-like n=1 Tax=Neomonachus schauinslandi TaxID=29088 RepID=A0A2Y9H0K5_NEOSC|nr:nuclear pore-associated protein 1-like [Neomonachus schauinslandi]
MGNLLCKFLPLPRRRLLAGRCRPLVTPACAAAHPGRDHPAVPALAPCPGRRPCQRHHRALPASFHVEPKRRYPICQAVCSPLGLLPLVNWRDPPKKPVLSAGKSMMFGPSRTVRIPPPGRKWTVLRSLPEPVVEAVKPVPSNHQPPSWSKGMEEKVQEVPREGMEDFVETRGQDDGNRAPQSSGDIPLTSRPLETGGVLSSHQGSPAPVGQSPNPPGDSLGENTQISLVSSPSEGPVVTSSHGPADNVVPLRKPDTDAVRLSDPTPSCPLLQERLTKEVVAENQPIQSVPHLPGKETEGDKPSGISSKYSFPPVSATSRPCKRKISMPLFVPLPSPLPLQWGRGELPPPPKLPCIVIDKNLGTLKNTKSQRNKVLEDGTEILAGCWATQPAPSSSLPPATHTFQVPVPTPDLADLSARPPIPSVPPSSPTENTDQETDPNSPPLSSSPTGKIPLKNGDPLHPVIAVTPISDHSTSPNTSTFSLQPPSCKGESLTPMCVDSPPLPVSSPDSPVFVQAITSKAVPSAITAKSSANLTSDGPSGSDVIDMDTTPPSYAIIFRSPPGPGVSSPSSPQGHCSSNQTQTAKVPVSTSSTTGAACPTPVLNQPFSLIITSQPTHGTLAGQHQTMLVFSTGSSIMSSGITTTAVGNTSANYNPHSDPDAMDTTPPSQAVIFQSPPQSGASQFPFYNALPGSDNTPPSSSTAVAHNSTHLPAQSAITQTSISNYSAPGITSQPTFGNQNGQQAGNSYLLGNQVAPTQAIGPTTPVAQLPKDSIMQSGLVGSAVATGMPSAGVSSSLLIPTTPGPPVFMGTAAPMDGGSFGFGVSVPGPTHSQASGALNYGAGQKGAPSTTSTPLFGPSQYNMAAAVGGASTVPVFGNMACSTLNPGTWGQPIQNTGGAVLGKDSTVPTFGGSSVPTTHKHTQGSSKQRKPAPGGRATTKEKRNVSRDVSAFPLNPSTKGGPTKKTGGAVLGKDSTVPTVGDSSMPRTHKRTQGSSKQTKPAPGGGTTTTVKRRLSRDMCVSPLNLSTGGQSTQNMGGAILGKNNAIPTVGGSSMPTTHKHTQGSSKQRKTAPGGGTTTTVKRVLSRDMCVSPLRNTWGSPGHTTSVVVSRTSSNCIHQPTFSSHLSPSTSGPPAQHTDGVKKRNIITPKTRKPRIPALHQRNSGPHDTNRAGTGGEGTASMMVGLSVTRCHQNTWSLPSTNIGGAMGISTTSTMTGNTNGPPYTQTTWSTPNHGTDGSMGDSAMEF